VSPERSDARLAAWLAFVAAFAALSYYGNLADRSASAEEPLYSLGFFASSVVGFSIMVGVALLVAVGADKRRLFALSAPRAWGRALWIAAAVLASVFVVSALVGLVLDPGEEQGLLPESWPPPDAAVFALNGLAVVVGAPLAEELMFRGLGYSLLERFGGAVAIAGSSAAWALAHGLIEAFPVIFVLGIGLGLLRRASRSILPGMLLHGVFNAIALTAAAVSAASG